MGDDDTHGSERGDESGEEDGDTQTELKVVRTQSVVLIPNALPKAKWFDTGATMEFTDTELDTLADRAGVVAVRQWFEGGYGQGVRMALQEVDHRSAALLATKFSIFEMEPSPSMKMGAILKNTVPAMPMLLEWCILSAHARRPLRAALSSGAEVVESVMDGCYGFFSDMSAGDLVPLFQACKESGYTFKRFSWTVADGQRPAVLRVSNSAGRAFAPWRRVELTKTVEAFVTGFEPTEYEDTGVASQWLRETVAGFQGYELRKTGARVATIGWSAFKVHVVKLVVGLPHYRAALSTIQQWGETHQKHGFQ